MKTLPALVAAVCAFFLFAGYGLGRIHGVQRAMPTIDKCIAVLDKCVMRKP